MVEKIADAFKEKWEQITKTNYCRDLIDKKLDELGKHIAKKWGFWESLIIEIKPDVPTKFLPDGTRLTKYTKAGDTVRIVVYDDAGNTTSGASIYVSQARIHVSQEREKRNFIGKTDRDGKLTWVISKKYEPMDEAQVIQLSFYCEKNSDKGETWIDVHHHKCVDRGWKVIDDRENQKEEEKWKRFEESFKTVLKSSPHALEAILFPPRYLSKDWERIKEIPFEERSKKEEEMMECMVKAAISDLRKNRNDKLREALHTVALESLPIFSKYVEELNHSP